MSQADLLRRGSVAFGILLFTVSFRLWWQDGSLYPQVPLLVLSPNLASPAWHFAGRVACVVTAASLVLQLARHSTPQRVGHVLFLLGASALVVLDQHRLQPWLQQLSLLSLFALLLPPSTHLRFARRLLISIYLFSAVSKCDYVFLHTIGQEFAGQLFQFAGQNFETFPLFARLAFAWIFPLSELAIGIGLMSSRSRKTSTWLAMLLHAALLLILGPLGLNHHWGVLSWNLFFLFQLWVLFLYEPGDAHNKPHSVLADEGLPAQKLAQPKWPARVCWLLVFLPLLEPFGLLDHWPAWQLYAPRNSRVTFSLLEQRVPDLPDELRRFVAQSDATELWQSFDIDAWSLEALGVPIYPQDRFQLGVCSAVARQFNLQGGIRVEVHSVSNRWNGSRTHEVLRGSDELFQATEDSYRLNAIPRPFPWHSE